MSDSTKSEAVKLNKLLTNDTLLFLTVSLIVENRGKTKKNDITQRRKIYSDIV